MTLNLGYQVWQKQQGYHNITGRRADSLGRKLIAKKIKICSSKSEKIPFKHYVKNKGHNNMLEAKSSPTWSYSCLTPKHSISGWGSKMTPLVHTTGTSNVVPTKMSVGRQWSSPKA